MLMWYLQRICCSDACVEAVLTAAAVGGAVHGVSAFFLRGRGGLYLLRLTSHLDCSCL
jgi:hypothetical protein